MNTHYLSMARRHFDRPYLPRHLVRSNIRKWAAAVRHLGPNWLALQPVYRITS